MQLKEQLEYDDVDHQDAKTSIDDEYATAGLQEPKILLTTSRDPSSRLMQFSKELRLLFPNTERLNRGNLQIKELADVARQSNFSDIIIIHEHRGEPDGMIISHLPYGPTAYFGLSNVILRHDLSATTDVANMSEAYPHLIFDQFSTKLGVRLKTILKYLFPAPKPETKRLITFANNDDIVSFRHHVYDKPEHNKVELNEIGPRFEMKLYQIKLGTLEMKEAENEWVLRPYMNAAKKRKAL